MFEFLSLLLRRMWFPKLRHLDVVIYTRMNCHLCDRAKEEIVRWQKRYQFRLQTVDVDEDLTLRESYGQHVPVVAINGKVRFRGRVNSVLLRRLLQAEASEKSQKRRRR